MKPKVFYNDSRNMKEVKDGTVRTVVTSPPYWDMYYYGHDEEIGYGYHWNTAKLQTKRYTFRLTDSVIGYNIESNDWAQEYCKSSPDSSDII